MKSLVKEERRKKKQEKKGRNTQQSIYIKKQKKKHFAKYAVWGMRFEWFNQDLIDDWIFPKMKPSLAIGSNSASSNRL
jgi:hypothetical protein